MPKQKSKNRKTLLLIDANSLIHRTYHALPPLTTPDGQAIQAIYGLTNILMKLFREEKPDYAAACFDRPEPTYRDKAYADYKAQRPATPDDLIVQLIEAHNLFPLFGIRTFEAPGYEADDLIATLAERFKFRPSDATSKGRGKNEKGLRVMILTGDLDTLQLVEGDHLVIRTFRKGLSDTFIYNEAAVKERYGLKPSQMTDYKALVGDASDNIKGVPGIGPKTAVELIKKFGSVEDMFKQIGKDETLKKKLGPFKKEAELSKKLVVLQREAPIDAQHIVSLATHLDPLKLAGYLRNLGFTKMVERLNGGAKENIPPKTPMVPQGSLFAASAPIISKKDMQETASADCIFVSELSLESLDATSLNSEKPKVGFGLKASLKKLRAHGKDLLPPYVDLEIAFWLLDPDQKSTPEFVFQKFLKSEWTGTDAELLRAYRFAETALKKNGLDKIFYEIEMPLLPILAEMETHGIGISRKALKTLGEEIAARLTALTKQIYETAGGEFNINSPKQLGEILFEKLGLKARRKTSGGQRSTSAETLETLKDLHPIIPFILHYREDFKIKSTYVDPLGELLDTEGRLHTEFVQTGTGTGRLSSRAPNLQNIPQESAWAPALRKAFVARPGHSFISFDYSQIELRIMASFSGDQSMQDAFRNNVDVHTLTASKVLKKPFDAVTKNDRRLAKTLNFGLIYGMGRTAFARASGVSSAEAATFIENYFKEFSRIRAWQEHTTLEAQTNGFLTTPTGRRRLFPAFASGIPYLRAEAERAALNFPIQSLDADIVKMAMIKSRTLLRERGLEAHVKLLLCIHDELLFEARDDMIDETVTTIRTMMEHVFPLGVPLTVGVSRGPSWGDMENIIS